jgi:biopolymer transport protein ExbD
MESKPSPNRPDRTFDLDAPSVAFRPLQAPRVAEVEEVIAVPPPPEIGDIKQKPLAWKGFEEDDEYEPEVSFAYQRDASEDEMDMTPMVDVTFLLLIFFMVTASFATEQAMDVPPNQEDVPSTVFVNPEDQNDVVEVIVDQNNSYRITSRDFEESEAPSETQMRAEVRNAKELLNARKLLVTAHEQAWTERVVAALDFGDTLGFEEVQLRTTTQEY